MLPLFPKKKTSCYRVRISICVPKVKGQNCHYTRTKELLWTFSYWIQPTLNPGRTLFSFRSFEASTFEANDIFKIPMIDQNLWYTVQNAKNFFFFCFFFLFWANGYSGNCGFHWLGARIVSKLQRFGSASAVRAVLPRYQILAW